MTLLGYTDHHALSLLIVIELTSRFLLLNKLVSICRFIEHDYVNTSNVLTLWMSIEQVGWQVPPALCGVIVIEVQTMQRATAVYIMGHKKRATLFPTTTTAFLKQLRLFYTSGNMNKYSTVYLLNGVMMSWLRHIVCHEAVTEVMLSTVRDDHDHLHFWSAFDWTGCSQLLQRVVQC